MNELAKTFPRRTILRALALGMASCAGCGFGGGEPRVNQQVGDRRRRELVEKRVKLASGLARGRRRP